VVWQVFGDFWAMSQGFSRTIPCQIMLNHVLSSCLSDWLFWWFRRRTSGTRSTIAQRRDGLRQVVTDNSAMTSFNTTYDDIKGLLKRILILNKMRSNLLGNRCNALVTGGCPFSEFVVLIVLISTPT
jgi:hypothetical protein